MYDRPDVKTNFRYTRFVIEPGRFLVGEYGIYVTKVLYKKESNGKVFLVVDPERDRYSSRLFVCAA